MVAWLEFCGLSVTRGVAIADGMSRLARIEGRVLLVDVSSGTLGLSGCLNEAIATAH